MEERCGICDRPVVKVGDKWFHADTTAEDYAAVWLNEDHPADLGSNVKGDRRDVPVPDGRAGFQRSPRQLGKCRWRHDGGVGALASRAHGSWWYGLSFGLALGLVGVLVVLALPIHITPGNGSLRCADSFFAGGLHYDDSEGLGAACDAAARNRLAHAGLLGAGLVVAGGAVALSRRPWRIVGWLGGGLIASVGFLAVFQNLMG